MFMFFLGVLAGIFLSFAFVFCLGVYAYSNKKLLAATLTKVMRATMRSVKNGSAS